MKYNFELEFRRFPIASTSTFCCSGVTSTKLCFFVYSPSPRTLFIFKNPKACRKDFWQWNRSSMSIIYNLKNSFLYAQYFSDIILTLADENMSTFEPSLFCFSSHPATKHRGPGSHPSLTLTSCVGFYPIFINRCRLVNYALINKQVRKVLLSKRVKTFLKRETLSFRVVWNFSTKFTNYLISDYFKRL